MANSCIVRISNKSKETLETLAVKSGEPMVNVIDRAIEEYRRRVFLEEANRAYAILRADEKASKEFNDEISAWDATLMDGLDRSESWDDEIKSSSIGKTRRKK